MSASYLLGMVRTFVCINIRKTCVNINNMEKMSNCNLNGDINAKIDNSDSKENVKDELLKQLHEQYAINNNANLSTIVTLVVAVIAVIGYFGYVYIHTGLEFSGQFGEFVGECCHSDTYYLDALLLVYLASVFVISILIHLCVYQGVAQRKEQFIIHAIRYKYLGENYLSDEEDKIFPPNYHPYNKHCLEVVQGLYGELIKIFKFILCALSFSMILKLLCFVFEYMDFNQLKIHVDICDVIFVVVIFFMVLIIYCRTYMFFCSQVKKYKKIEYEYSKLNPQKAKKSINKCSSCSYCIYSKCGELNENVKTNK